MGLIIPSYIYHSLRLQAILLGLGTNTAYAETIYCQYQSSLQDGRG